MGSSTQRPLRTALSPAQAGLFSKVSVINARALSSAPMVVMKMKSGSAAMTASMLTSSSMLS